jgi:uncharacterized protein (TIGR02147 family)
MSVFPEDPRFYVRSEYELRNLRNPSYSWRSFARDLKLSPSMLSEFLKGRYGLSRGKATQVAEMIRLDSTHTEHFIDLLESDFHRAQSQRQLAKLRVAERMKNPSTHISRETLADILDWTYFAVLEVVGLERGKMSAESWTKPFRTCAQTLQGTVQKLIDLKLLRREGDAIVPAEEVTIASDQLPPQEIQKLHAQVLNLGQMALSELNPDEREAISIFASIRADDFAEMRKELNDSLIQVLNKYSSKSDADAVFCFGLQAFPIYRKKK